MKDTELSAYRIEALRYEQIGASHKLYWIVFEPSKQTGFYVPTVGAVLKERYGPLLLLLEMKTSFAG